LLRCHDHTSRTAPCLLLLLPERAIIAWAVHRADALRIPAFRLPQAQAARNKARPTRRTEVIPHAAYERRQDARIRQTNTQHLLYDFDINIYYICVAVVFTTRNLQ
jgi:hypothetical protein